MYFKEWELTSESGSFQASVQRKYKLLNISSSQEPEEECKQHNLRFSIWIRNETVWQNGDIFQEHYFFEKSEISVTSLHLQDRQLIDQNFEFLLPRKTHPDPCFH